MPVRIYVRSNISELWKNPYGIIWEEKIFGKELPVYFPDGLHYRSMPPVGLIHNTGQYNVPKVEDARAIWEIVKNHTLEHFLAQGTSSGNIYFNSESPADASEKWTVLDPYYWDGFGPPPGATAVFPGKPFWGKQPHKAYAGEVLPGGGSTRVRVQIQAPVSGNWHYASKFSRWKWHVSHQASYEYVKGYDDFKLWHTAQDACIAFQKKYPKTTLRIVSRVDNKTFVHWNSPVMSPSAGKAKKVGMHIPTAWEKNPFLAAQRLRRLAKGWDQLGDQTRVEMWHLIQCLPTENNLPKNDVENTLRAVIAIVKNSNYFKEVSATKTVTPEAK